MIGRRLWLGICLPRLPRPVVPSVKLHEIRHRIDRYKSKEHRKDHWRDLFVSLERRLTYIKRYYWIIFGGKISGIGSRYSVPLRSWRRTIRGLHGPSTKCLMSHINYAWWDSVNSLRRWGRHLDGGVGCKLDRPLLGLRGAPPLTTNTVRTKQSAKSPMNCLLYIVNSQCLYGNPVFSVRLDLIMVYSPHFGCREHRLSYCYCGWL
jgi:hypothetical protein